MGVINKLNGKIIFLDTAPLIYYIEENINYNTFLNKLFAANSKGKFHFQTSVITLLEVLVIPIRQNKDQLVEAYQNILCHSTTINILDLTVEIARLAASLRAKYGIRTPDSIQVATAIHASCDYFLTNDIRLKTIKEMKFIILDEVANN